MIVKTQAELDAAIKAGETYIEIRSERGVWIGVSAPSSGTIAAYDGSTIAAYDGSTIAAYGSSTVRAYDSSTVTAYDSSTVTAYGSSTVTAYDGSTIAAYDSSTVRAHGSSTVRAKSRCAVHFYGGGAHIEGGVLIDHTREPKDAAGWCAWHDVEVADGIATLYKAVDDEWTTTRGTYYSPGSLPACYDWIDDNECGGGLHFSPSPVEATAYHPEATHWVAVGVAVADLRPILGGTAKAKAPRVVRACVEVDIDGRVI